MLTTKEENGDAFDYPCYEEAGHLDQVPSNTKHYIMYCNAVNICTEYRSTTVPLFEK